MSVAIKKVVLLGTDSRLGPAILKALTSSSFQVTALKRASSKSNHEYPVGVQVAKVRDDFPDDAVADTLRGQLEEYAEWFVTWYAVTPYTWRTLMPTLVGLQPGIDIGISPHSLRR